MNDELLNTPHPPHPRACFTVMRLPYLSFTLTSPLPMRLQLVVISRVWSESGCLTTQDQLNHIFLTLLPFSIWCRRRLLFRISQ